MVKMFLEFNLDLNEEVIVHFFNNGMEYYKRYLYEFYECEIYPSKKKKYVDNAKNNVTMRLIELFRLYHKYIAPSNPVPPLTFEIKCKKKIN